jgi:hypothetical protein
VIVNEGPHPTHQRVPGVVCQGHALPLPQQPWYFDEKQLSEEARGRLSRWRDRWEAKQAGGPVLSLAKLGSLIKQTQRTLDSTSAPGDVAILSVQLEDMKHEFDWRTFLDVDETIWPAEPLTKPVDM